MKLEFIICVLLLIVACKKEEAVPMNSPVSASERQKFLELALEKGDTIAYYNLSKDYFDSPYKGFLEISREMADNHHYHLAYHDVYLCLTEKSNLDSLDSETNSLALRYLTEGAEKGNLNCMTTLGHLLIEGKHMTKDTVRGKELIEKAGIE